jgi:hypothetical protein
MDIERIGTKYEKALEIKTGVKYAEALQTELAKSEWKDKLSAAREAINSITSSSDFDKARKQLEALFDQIYEKITAPGLDAFISWVNEHTKNQDNVNKLRQFVKDNYETYSSSIDAISSAMENLPQEDEKHLFDSLLTNFNKKLKTDVSTFVNSPDKFENNIEGFLDLLKSEYAGISTITELSYTKVEDLYTKEQKALPNIAFYNEIMNYAIRKGQSLNPVDDTEKGKELHIIISKRIKSITSCIAALIKSGIADLEDTELKDLFKRYYKEMFIGDGHLDTILSSYLTKTWNPLQEKYEKIQAFYELKEKNFKESDWDGFDKASDLTALCNDYRSVRLGNVLSSLASMKLEEIASKINSCHKKIDDLLKKESTTCDSVKDYFEDFVETYNDKKSMLDKILAKHSELKELYDEIYGQGKALTTIENGIQTISAVGVFLDALEDGTIFDMIDDMKKIKRLFVQIIQQSGMEKEINWLNSLSSTSIDETSFNSDYLLKLIKDKLITISFEKQF